MACRQLPRLAGGNEAGAQPLGHRGPQDEAAALDAHHQIDPLGPERLGQPLHGVRQPGRVAQQGRDVAEPNARLRKVGNVPNLRFQVFHGCFEVSPETVAFRLRRPPDQPSRRLPRSAPQIPGSCRPSSTRAGAVYSISIRKTGADNPGHQVVHRDRIDTSRRRRALPERPFEPVHRFPLALGFDLDPPVGEIPDESAEPLPGGGVARVEPVPDALHAAGNHESPSDNHLASDRCCGSLRAGMMVVPISGRGADARLRKPMALLEGGRGERI